MDSLTHIVLGAAVGETTLGNKIGNKALIWGAIAGSFPDFDVMVSPLYEPVKSLFMHRGFSHSIVFAIIVSLAFGWILSSIYKSASLKEWIWMFLLSMLVHSGIDCFNTYGTGLLEPFSSNRLAFDSLGIIDFFLVLPILAIMIYVALRKQSSIRRKLSIIALGFTFLYLGFSIINKISIERTVKDHLKTNNIEFSRIKTSPLPLTNFLWLVIAEDSVGYHFGYYSVFDKKPMQLKYIERQEYNLGEYGQNARVKDLIRFTKGFYAVRNIENTIWLYDLRFGSMAFESEDNWFVFSFQIDGDNDLPTVSRSHPNRSFGSKTFNEYLERVFRDI